MVIQRQRSLPDEWVVEEAFRQYASKGWLAVPRWSLSCGFVYFIEAVGADRIKIGWAVTPEFRLHYLQTGSPYPLILLKKITGGRDIERWFHRLFASVCVGGEWFRMVPELQNFALSETMRVRLPEPMPKMI